MRPFGQNQDFWWDHFWTFQGHNFHENAKKVQKIVLSQHFPFQNISKFGTWRQKSGLFGTKLCTLVPRPSGRSGPKKGKNWPKMA